MAFELMERSMYRSLDLDQLVERKSAILAEVENTDSKFSVAELNAEADACVEAIEMRNAAIKMRAANIAAVEAGAGRVIERSAAAKVECADRFDTPEYRKGFMDYCRTGIVPIEMREDQHTLTTDVPLQIPTVMQNKIVQKIEEYGILWNEVTKTNFKGNTWIRVMDINPTATWIDEDEVSDYQKVTDGTKITFMFYQLECRMAQSQLAEAVTFDDFQAMMVPAIAKAMVKALEAAILNGDGDGKFLGITKEPRITKSVTMEASEMADWKAWHKNFKKAIPTAYRNGKLYMAQTTWDQYIETLADKDDAPISTSYNGVTGEEIHRLCGIPVVLLPENYLKDYDAAGNNEVFAFYGDLKDYCVNTQPGMPMTTKRWVDEDKNLVKTKCLMAADGKVVDAYGFMLLKKNTSA